MNRLSIQKIGLLFFAFAMYYPSIAYGVCAEGEIRIPIEFQFAAPDLREDWIYRSTLPRLLVKKQHVTILAPERESTTFGIYSADFCVDSEILARGFKVRFGPRETTISPRPVDPKTNTMTTIRLLEQPRPDWVVIKSIKKLTLATSALPVFDVEISNFGKPYSGASVRLQARYEPIGCASNSVIELIPVTVSAVKSRIKVTSADPEFPTQQIDRNASIAASGCGFDLSVDLGTVGTIPEGPSRLRYEIRRARIPDSKPHDKRLLDSAIASIEISVLPHYGWSGDRSKFK